MMQSLRSHAAAPFHALTLTSITVDGTLAPPPPELTRRLAFVGDSITAGLGAGHDATADAGARGRCGPDNEASDATWAHRLCRRFRANCSVVAWSGKCLYVEGSRAMVMPDYYRQATGAGAAPHTHDWDFRRFVPNAVVVNLGTNDYRGYTGPEWEAAFTREYVRFMTNLTVWHHNTALPIFAAVGPMTSRPAAAVRAAVSAFNALGGNAHFLDVTVGPHAHLSGGCGHPGRRDHRRMYEIARAQVAAVLGWR